MVASLRIQRLIPYDAIALCACEDDFVRVKFAGGEDRAGLESLTVRQGEGLVGWVAEVGKPILNGNPAVEPGYARRDGAPGLSPRACTALGECRTRGGHPGAVSQREGRICGRRTGLFAGTVSRISASDPGYNAAGARSVRPSRARDGQRRPARWRSPVNA